MRSGPTASRTRRARAAAPSARLWKNERTEIRSGEPSTTSVTQPREPVRMSAATTTDACGGSVRMLRSPVATPARTVTSLALSNRPFRRTSSTSGCATRHVSIEHRFVRRWRRNAARPSSTRARTVERYPVGGSETGSSRGGSSTAPMRRNASRTMSSFSRGCAAGAMCCQPQPPHPARANSQGGVIRSGEASTIATTRARSMSGRSCVTSASTRSPGSAPSTSTIRPSVGAGQRVAARHDALSRKFHVAIQLCETAFRESTAGARARRAGPGAATGRRARFPNRTRDEVRLRVRGASLNFPDVLMCRGAYQVKPPLPFTPGAEVAGVVDAVGAEVIGVDVGDRVLAIPNSGRLHRARQSARHAPCSRFPTRCRSTRQPRCTSSTRPVSSHCTGARTCSRARRCSCTRARAGSAARRSSSGVRRVRT